LAEEREHVSSRDELGGVAAELGAVVQWPADGATTGGGGGG